MKEQSSGAPRQSGKEASPRTGVLRKVGRWVFRLTAGVLLLLVLAVGGALLLLRTEWAGEKILALAADALAPSGMILEADKLAAPLPGGVYIHGLRVSDAEGLLFAADEAALELSLFDLFKREFRISQLRLSGPELVRLPPPSSPAQPEPEEPTESGPFVFPELPVAVYLDTLVVENARIAWDVTGVSPEELAASLRGAAGTPESGEREELATLMTQAFDAPLALDLNGSADLQDGVLGAAFALRAAAGDVRLATDLTPVSFVLRDAADPARGMHGTAALRVALDFPWEGKTAEGLLELNAGLEMPGPATPAAANPAATGIGLAIEALRLRFLGIALDADGAVALDSGEARAKVALDAPVDGGWLKLALSLSGGDTTLPSRLADPHAVLTLRTEAARSGGMLRLSKFSLQGLGLDARADASLREADAAFQAELSIASETKAPWQPIVAGLGGMEPSLLAALADPIRIEGKAGGDGAGNFDLDIDMLQAGQINASGTVDIDAGDASVNAALALSVAELGRFGAGVSGPLAVRLDAGGTLSDVNGTLAFTSPWLVTNAGAMAALVSRIEGGFVRDADGSIRVSGDIDTRTASGPGGPASIKGSMDFAMPGTQRGVMTAALRQLSVSGFGLAVDGDLDARVPMPFPDMAGLTAAGLWPKGLTLDGDLSAGVHSWEPLAALLALPISGDAVSAEIHCAHSGDVQSVDMDLDVGALRLPEQGDISLNSLAASLTARLGQTRPDLNLSLDAGPGSAGGIPWAGVSAEVAGSGLNGTFSLVATTPAWTQRTDTSASITTVAEEEERQARSQRIQERRAARAAERAAAQTGGEAGQPVASAPAASGSSGAAAGSGTGQGRRARTIDMLSVKGSYDLQAMHADLEELMVLEPSSRVSASLEAPVRVSFANGVQTEGLSIAMTPGGAVLADASLLPGKAEINARIVDLPLALINQAAALDLPLGVLNAELAYKGGKGDPVGSLQLLLTLDDSVFASSTGIDRTLPALKADASFVREGRSLRLKGTASSALLAQTPNPAGGDIPAPELPLTFSIPMRMDASGFPVPVMDAPLEAAFRWAGPVAPLWHLVPMPERDVSGIASADIRIGGTLNAPDVNGSVYLAGGRFEDKSLGVLLTDINLEAAAENTQRFRVVLALSDGAAGSVGLEGNVDLGGEGSIAMRGQVRHLAPLHRDDLSIVISGLLGVDGSLSAPKVSAHIMVEEGEVVLLSSLLGSSSVPTLEITEAGTADKAPGSGPSSDIRIEVPRRFYIRGRGLDSEWMGNLAITGQLSEPQLVGSLAPVRGTFDLLSRTFQFTGGEIEFLGGNRINPGINLELTYNGADITGIIRAGGTASKPSLTLDSIPPLPEDEVLAQVLFGKRVSDLSRFEMIQLANGLREIAGMSEGGLDPLTTMRKATGLDVLRLGSTGGNGQARQDSGLSGASNLAGQSAAGGVGETGPALEAGKYLGDSIYIGVEQGLTQEETAVRVEIELFPNVTLQGRSSTESSQAGIGWKMDY
ncbi:translocation/assembly module TamB [Desulfovibrio sp. OttesenSCG-928-I05]|nr:translocation/assembly module TamB [Desulfovibrio sp. OttesenSCG-928-I05]